MTSPGTTRLGYRFAPDDAPIWVATDMPLEPHARRFWRAWPFTRDSTALDRPDITIAALPSGLAGDGPNPPDHGGFRLAHGAIAGGFMDCPNAEEAANQLAGVLVAVRVRAMPVGVAVHAASCETPAGVVVLPGPSMSGKSTLSLQLMLRGGRLFGDDRLLLDAPKATAIALGLTPRVRLPVPDEAGPDLVRLAAECGTTDGGIAYLDLATTEAAPFGVAARIAAFVAPERIETGESRLEKASTATMVRALLGGAVTGEGASAATLEAVAALAARIPCWRLAWRSSAAAGDLLWRRFGDAGRNGA